MKGVFTALVTPFNTDGTIDWTAFDRILEDQRAAGVAGVIPCGTTGESPTLTTDEKKSLVTATLKKLRGSSVKVLAGTGGNDTAETLALSRWAASEGVDGVLIVTPYYNKPTPAGLERHFLAVADAVGAASKTCEVMLYNVPGRTGVSLTPASVATLAAHERIRSLKEATGNVAFTSEIIDALDGAGRKLDILSGDDATYLPLLSVGATGVVSVASNLFPRAMVAILKNYADGKPAAAFELHRRFYPLFRDLFVESNPGPIKAAMRFAGWCREDVRAPLAPLTEASRKKLEESLKRCGVASGNPL